MKPPPLWLAQLVYAALQCCGQLMVALGSAISFFHIFYVIKFETLFSMDPQEVSKRTFNILAIIIIVPNSIVAIYNTVNGVHVAGTVALQTQSEYNGQGVPFIPAYSISWTLLMVTASFIAYIFIPTFFTTRQPTPHQQQPQQRSKFLRRGLLISLVFFISSLILVIISEKNDNLERPVTSKHYFFVFSFDLLLMNDLSEKNAVISAQRYIFNLLHIEENYNIRGGRLQNQDTSEHFPQHPRPETSIVNLTNVFPMSTFISVVPANISSHDL
jgi:heme/copper-type cytochrome/quinol oxidase subunit 2